MKNFQPIAPGTLELVYVVREEESGHIYGPFFKPVMGYAEWHPGDDAGTYLGGDDEPTLLPVLSATPYPSGWNNSGIELMFVPAFIAEYKSGRKPMDVTWAVMPPGETREALSQIIKEVQGLHWAEYSRPVVANANLS